ncbi:unnamed protein product, partial [Prorocentrum cordatum]
RDPGATDTVSKIFGERNTTVEQTALDHHEVEGEQRGHFVGRAHGFQRGLHAACDGKFEELLDSAQELELEAMFKLEQEDVWITWLAAVKHLSEQPDDDIPTLCERAERFQARAIGASLAKSRRSFQQWATNTWEHALGVPHRHVKQQGDAVQIPKDEHIYKKAKGIDVLDPLEVHRLPGAGRAELATFLNAVEEHGLRPRQIFSTLGAV